MEKNLEPEENLNPFGERNVRRSFKNKLYSVLFVQILVNLCIIGVFLEPNLSDFCKNAPSLWPFWTSLVTIYILATIMSMVTPIRRRAPYNYICLAIFTLFMGLLLGISSATFSSIPELMMAVGSSAIIVIILNIVQFTTDKTIISNTDETTISLTEISFISFFSSFLTSWLIFGLISFCVPDFMTWRLICSGCGVLIASGYIILDIHLMIGKWHSNFLITPEEYVFGVLNLSIDILLHLYNFFRTCVNGLLVLSECAVC